MQGTAEFNHEDFEQTRAAEQDQKLLVKFYYKTVKDQGASEEQGRAVFKEVEYVDIRIPGARGTGAARPATARDKKRFERHYQAFKQRIELPVEGTPLVEWPLINRSMAEELAFAGVKTVEQMAGMSDVVASQFMGGQMFKDKAQKWLDRAQADVTVTQLEGELAKRDTLIAQMEKRLAELEKPAKRKRRTREEIDRDNELSNSGERSAEQSGFGGGADTGS
jgi:hypothetical protein